MAKFVAGDDPADHTNAEVVEFLTGDECTPDEYDRVMASERGNRNRVGILNGTGADEPAEPMQAPDGTDAAGPNEAATGQESPADEAKTVDDPHASGDEALTANQYPEDAPASLGPEMPQTDAEQEAHDATVAALSKEQRNALPIDVREGGVSARAGETQTAADALRAASERSSQWARPLAPSRTDVDES